MGTERGSHQPSPAPVTGPGLCPGSVGTQHPWMAGPSCFHGQGPSQLFTKPLPVPPPTDPQVDAHPSMKPPHPKPSGAQGCLGPNTTGCTGLGSLGKLCPLFPQEQGAVCREGQRCGRPVHSTTPAPCAEVTPDPQTPPDPLTFGTEVLLQVPGPWGRNPTTGTGTWGAGVCGNVPCRPFYPLPSVPAFSSTEVPHGGASMVPQQGASDTLHK